MTEWTSISVTEEQKELLQAEKPENTAMGKFIVGLLEGDTDDEPMQVVPVKEVVGREVPESNLEQDTDALRHQLERNYEAIVEATNAAQSADKKLGEMRQ